MRVFEASSPCLWGSASHIIGVDSAHAHGRGQARGYSASMSHRSRLRRRANGVVQGSITAVDQRQGLSPPARVAPLQQTWPVLVKLPRADTQGTAVYTH